MEDEKKMYINTKALINLSSFSFVIIFGIIARDLLDDIYVCHNLLPVPNFSARAVIQNIKHHITK